MTILAQMGEGSSSETSAEPPGTARPERTGIFTSGIVSTREGRTVALFFTGRKHAGENLAQVLAHRAEGLGPPCPDV